MPPPSSPNKGSLLTKLVGAWFSRDSFTWTRISPSASRPPRRGWHPSGLTRMAATTKGIAAPEFLALWHEAEAVRRRSAVLPSASLPTRPCRRPSPPPASSPVRLRTDCSCAAHRPAVPAGTPPANRPMNPRRFIKCPDTSPGILFIQIFHRGNGGHLEVFLRSCRCGILFKLRMRDGKQHPVLICGWRCAAGIALGIGAQGEISQLFPADRIEPGRRVTGTGLQ